MTTGNVLYLIMCLGMFAAFALVLAYESWQQARLGPDLAAEPDSPALAAEPDNQIEPHGAIAA